MTHSTDLSKTATAAIDPLPIRLIKRVLLVVLGPFYFLYIAFVPLICVGRKGFRGWYWRTVKRACSRLLWLLSIRVDMSDANKAELRGDTDSIIVINHRSHLDAVACIIALKPRLRFGFVVKRSLSLIPIWGWFIWLNGYIPVDRERRGRRDQLSSGVKYLQKGRSVLVFPEGTRAPDHRFRNFKKGAAVLAIRSQRPVLPITVSGTASLLPKNSLYVRYGVVRIQIHPPISTDGYRLEQRDELVSSMRDVIASSYRLEAEGPTLETNEELLAQLVQKR